MGRRSLVVERREQILAAFERCVTKYGLDGATIDLIAQEAKVKPSIIRHYIGNWEDLVKALMDRVISSYRVAIEKVFHSLPENERIDAALDTLFSDQSFHPAQSRMVLGIMMTTREQYPEAKRRLVEFFEEMVNTFATALHTRFPNASQADCRETAYSIICLSLANDSFAQMGVEKEYLRHARASADVLLLRLG